MGRGGVVRSVGRGGFVRRIGIVGVAGASDAIDNRLGLGGLRPVASADQYLAVTIPAAIQDRDSLGGQGIRVGLVTEIT